MLGMRAGSDTTPNRQLELLAADAAPAAATHQHAGYAGRVARDRVTVDLRALGPRLRTYAALQGKRPASLMRQAVSQMLESIPEPSGVSLPGGGTTGMVARVTLRMPSLCARSLAERARAADVSQGEYVRGLLDGSPPAPPAPGHAATVAALMASTDRLAAMSSDLTAFLRLLGRVPVSELEAYRAGLKTLTRDVREHLACAAALIAELKMSRRPRK
jgi:hypothetical protein